jgi:AI-2 transport protein TqsA
MPEGGRRVGAERFLLLAASVVVVVAGLKAAAPLVLPFMVAVFLAILSLPLLTWLQARRVPMVLAVVLTILADLAVLAIIVLMVSGSVQGFMDAVPRYRERLDAMSANAVAWLQSKGLEAKQLIPQDRFKPGNLLDLAVGTARGAAVVLSNIVLVILTMIFILFEAAGFPAKLRRALGRAEGDLSRYARITSEVQRYLAIKTLVSVVTGLLAGVVVAAAGVDFPVLWGLVACLLNYVPNLGSIIAAVPPVLLALVQYGPGRALVVAAGFLAINMVLGNFVEPALMGRKLGLSTLVVFLSLVFWGWVWGPVGMLLSVPLTMVVKIMLENTAETQWIAALLDVNPHGREEPPPVEPPAA